MAHRNRASRARAVERTADPLGASVVLYSAISTPPAVAPDPTRTGTVLVGSLLVPIPLADTVWNSTGGNVAFSEQATSPANLTVPSAGDQAAAPLILLPKINGSINVPFHCWPGTVSAAAPTPPATSNP